MNIFFIIRLILGLLFVVSGGEKVLSPIENFVYVIEGYKVFSLPMAKLVAFVFPWVELTVGLFILTGLWLQRSLLALALISFLLMIMVTQAIVRQLPLDNCGCFGELVHLPLKGVLLIDVTVFCLSILCLRYVTRTAVFSLDAFYAKNPV